MALATSVNLSDGVVVSGGNEKGSYSYTNTRTKKNEDGEDETSTYETTVYYTDYRQEKVWTGLTLQACLDFISSYPNAICSYSCVNRNLQAYELTVTTLTRSTTGSTTVKVPEQSE